MGHLYADCLVQTRLQIVLVFENWHSSEIVAKFRYQRPVKINLRPSGASRFWKLAGTIDFEALAPPWLTGLGLLYSLVMGGFMSNATDVLEVIIEKSATIRNLDLEAAPMRERLARIDAEREGLKAEVAAMVVAMNTGPHPPSHEPSKASRPRQKRPFAGTGTIKDVLDHLKAHPGQEVTPESVAAALGQPEKNGLAATCLKRLYEAGLVHRPRTGHYAYLQQVEATMT
jgi:hypothetical protein